MQPSPIAETSIPLAPRRLVSSLVAAILESALETMRATEGWRRPSLAPSPVAGEGVSRSLGGLDPHRLDVEILLHLLQPGLAPVAAHLVAAERHRGIHRLVAIDPDRAGANCLGEPVRLADVACPDPAAEAERG